MFWAAAAAAVGSAYIGGKSAKSAANAQAGAADYATRESKRQFDITQEQLAPFREAGLRGLDQYEAMLGQYGDFDVTNDLPPAHVSNRNLPEFSFESGNYDDLIQSDIPESFRYTDFESDPGRLERIEAGNEALSSRGLSAYDPNLSSNLATREFSRARGRAYDDYLTDVSRERERYGRSYDDYTRQTGRERELYGRGRQRYLDEFSREGVLDDRRYREYQSQVGTEEERRRRDLERYGRLYVDPLSRYAEMAGIGQSTTTGLGQLRQSYASQVAGNTARSGRSMAAGTLGQQNAYATALEDLAYTYERR